MARTGVLAEIGALIGDPGRANMLSALLDGRAVTAKELAAYAGVTPQTASGHLAKLVSGRLITVERQGRNHYHRLASADIARMLESMMSVAEASEQTARLPIRVGPKDEALRQARTCYDHLAGRLGVGLAQSMVGRGHLLIEGDSASLTESGRRFLTDFGVELQAPQRCKRVFCKPCLDWSERRPHIGGGLGAALMDRVFALAWVQRIEGTRAIKITRRGEAGLRDVFAMRDEPPRRSNV